MALTRNVIFIAFVLLVLVNITTQKKKKRQATGPWWQCDDLVTVKKGVNIPWNPDSQTITFTTDSEDRSGEKVVVAFYKDGSYAGTVNIGFNTEIQYYLVACSTGYTPFPAALPTETEKTWTITYNHTKQTVVFHCNGVQVLNVLLSDSACDRSYWTYFWGKKPTQIKFLSSDTASDSYCFSSNPGPWKLCDDNLVPVREKKIPWNPDSQTITISTDSEAGSNQEVEMQFSGAAGALAGSVHIYFYTEIKYNMGYCSSETPFPAALPTETKKTWTITYNYTEHRLVFHCNGVKVLNVLLSSACNISYWTYHWGKKPRHIKFGEWDGASDTYCFSSNPGAI